MRSWEPWTWPLHRAPSTAFTSASSRGCSRASPRAGAGSRRRRTPPTVAGSGSRPGRSTATSSAAMPCLSWRAGALGAEPWFTPAARVAHHHDLGARGLWRERVPRGEEFGRARARLRAMVAAQAWRSGRRRCPRRSSCASCGRDVTPGGPAGAGASPRACRSRRSGTRAGAPASRWRGRGWRWVAAREVLHGHHLLRRRELRRRRRVRRPPLARAAAPRARGDGGALRGLLRRGARRPSPAGLRAAGGARRSTRCAARGGRLSPLWTHQTGGPGPQGPRAAARCSTDGRFDVVHFHNISLIGGPGVIEMAPAGGDEGDDAARALAGVPHQPAVEVRPRAVRPAHAAPPARCTRAGRLSCGAAAAGSSAASRRSTTCSPRASTPRRRTAQRGIDVPIRVLPYHVPVGLARAARAARAAARRPPLRRRRRAPGAGEGVRGR